MILFGESGIFLQILYFEINQKILEILKNNLINNYYKEVQEQCKLDQDAQMLPQTNAYGISQGQITEDSFTGRHNIDDISCVILFKFFKYKDAPSLSFLSPNSFVK